MIKKEVLKYIKRVNAISQKSIMSRVHVENGILCALSEDGSIGLTAPTELRDGQYNTRGLPDSTIFYSKRPKANGLVDKNGIPLSFIQEVVSPPRASVLLSIFPDAFHARLFNGISELLKEDIEAEKRTSIKVEKQKNFININGNMFYESKIKRVWDPEECMDLIISADKKLKHKVLILRPQDAAGVSIVLAPVRV